MPPLSSTINTWISHVSLRSLRLQLSTYHSITLVTPLPCSTFLFETNFSSPSPLLYSSPICNFIFSFFPLLPKALNQPRLLYTPARLPFSGIIQLSLPRPSNKHLPSNAICHLSYPTITLINGSNHNSNHQKLEVGIIFPHTAKVPC